MNRIGKYLFTYILFVLSNIAIGQAFAPIGAEWYYSDAGYDGYYHYKSEKDTTVSGVFCQKILIQRVKNDSSVSFLNPKFTYQSNDTVYYFHNRYNKFVPLYIFDVSIGDTLTFYLPEDSYSNNNDSIFKVIVDNVTSVTINSQLLKKIYVSEVVSCYYTYRDYTELIGSSLSMLPHIACIIPESGMEQLRCYSDSTLNYDADNYLSCDYLSTGIKNLNFNSKFTLYPNPTKTFIRIQASQNEEFDYKIYNSQGLLVISGNIESNSSTIQIEYLAEGLYYITLYNDEQFKTIPFIINK
jgi:hypothetical protein